MSSQHSIAKYSIVTNNEYLTYLHLLARIPFLDVYLRQNHSILLITVLLPLYVSFQAIDLQIGGVKIMQNLLQQYVPHVWAHRQDDLERIQHEWFQVGHPLELFHVNYLPAVHTIPPHHDSHPHAHTLQRDALSQHPLAHQQQVFLQHPSAVPLPRALSLHPLAHHHPHIPPPLE